MRTTLTLAAGSALLFLPSCNGQKKASANGEKTTPNIVYILADDMGYGDIRAYNPACKIPTPALDSLAAEGIAFTDAHTNSAVSTPTRYGILTGRYAFRSRLKNGVLVGHDPSLIEPGRETVATLLRKGGYHTACIGKWHLGLDWARHDTTKPVFTGNPWDITDTGNIDYTGPVHGGPSDHGFDYSYVLPASLDIAPYVYVENGRVNSPVSTHTPAWRNDKARGMWYRHGDKADNFDHSDCLQHFTRKAVEYITGSAGRKEPFFLYFPLTAPHTPWLPSAEFEGKSGAGVYGDFVCMVDDVVRQVRQALRESGQLENTIIVFTSDNGSSWNPEDIEETGHRANAHFSGKKSDIWEGGHRVPFIVSWPLQIKEGKQCDEVICTTDLMATCAEMTGLSLVDNAGEDSYSFWKILTGQPYTSPLREATIHHSIEGYFALRQGDWVYLDAHGSGGWSLPEKQAVHLPAEQLYNLKEDPAEQHNLVASHPDKVRSMKQLLDRYVSSGRSR